MTLLDAKIWLATITMYTLWLREAKIKKKVIWQVGNNGPTNQNDWFRLYHDWILMLDHQFIHVIFGEEYERNNHLCLSGIYKRRTKTWRDTKFTLFSFFQRPPDQCEYSQLFCMRYGVKTPKDTDKIHIISSLFRIFIKIYLQYKCCYERCLSFITVFQYDSNVFQNMNLKRFTFS